MTVAAVVAIMVAAVVAMALPVPSIGGSGTSAPMAAAVVRRIASTPAAGEAVTVRLNDMRRAGMIEFVDRKILLKHPPDLAPA